MIGVRHSGTQRTEVLAFTEWNEVPLPDTKEV